MGDWGVPQWRIYTRAYPGIGLLCALVNFAPVLSLLTNYKLKESYLPPKQSRASGVL